MGMPKVGCGVHRPVRGRHGAVVSWMAIAWAGMVGLSATCWRLATGTALCSTRLSARLRVATTGATATNSSTGSFAHGAFALTRAGAYLCRHTARAAAYTFAAGTHGGAAATGALAAAHTAAGAATGNGGTGTATAHTAGAAAGCGIAGAATTAHAAGTTTAAWAGTAATAYATGATATAAGETASTAATGEATSATATGAGTAVTDAAATAATTATALCVHRGQRQGYPKKSQAHQSRHFHGLGPFYFLRVNVSVFPRCKSTPIFLGKTRCHVLFFGNLPETILFQPKMYKSKCASPYNSFSAIAAQASASASA